MRYSPEWDGRQASLRLSGYGEKRGAGLAGAESRAVGAALAVGALVACLLFELAKELEAQFN